LIAFAVVCYFIFARTLQSSTDRFISDALTAFSREALAERRLAPTVAEALQTTVNEVRFRDLHIVILNDSGRVQSMSPAQGDEGGKRLSTEDGGRIVAALAATDHMRPLAITLSEDRGRIRVIARPLAVRGQQFMLAGAYPLNDVDDTLARIRGMFFIAIPLLIIIAATGGSFLARRSLAPLSSMAARAAEISATTLHERLPIAANDELGGLARVVNDLLDRLQRSFSQQQRFMADASHELRTPTAILRSEADVTLSREHRDEEEYRASITIMRDASRRLTRIVDDLFLLARADTGHLVVHSDTLYLEELMHDATRGVRQIADRRGVKVELGQVVEAPFHGDADLLGRLLLNLLDNAIKYSPEGGRVEVGMTRRNGTYAITVVDEGPGIPLDAHERVFERFFRVDTARSRSENSTTSGAGLGLAIARRIAEVHGGTLELAESRPGRTEFRLTLPADGKAAF
jgi:heavy metal sensor kinase